MSPTTADHVAGDLDGRSTLSWMGAHARWRRVDHCVLPARRPSHPAARRGVARGHRKGARAPGRGARGAPGDERALAPGMLASHYAPRAAVRLGAQEPWPTKLRSISAGGYRAEARGSTCPPLAICGRRRRICSLSAPAGRIGRAGDRSRANSHERTWRGDQRPASAGRCAAVVTAFSSRLGNTYSAVR